MGLSGSMWTGVSGLLVHGEKMNVVGHNIANVNTIGFKSQRMDFQDLFYNNTFSAAGLEQVGMGVRVGMVLNDFSQGPFEQTGLSTDLAIMGKGWFQVRVPNQDMVYYTRAGDFSFNKEGELKNPQGYILQGWQVPLETGPSIGMGVTPAGAVTSPILGTGVPKDITLDTWTVPPLQTSTINMYCDLSAYSTDNARWDSNPFAALFNTWDGQLLDPITNTPINRNNQPYMPATAFAYQSSIKIYDEAGVAHTVTIYYDKVERNYNASGYTYYDGGKPSETVWEYIVTINPAEDNRMIWQTDAAGNPALTGPVSIQTTQMAGILMSGTITFSGSGQMIDQSAYTLMGDYQAVTLDTNTGNASLLPHYGAVWTDPNDPTYTKTFPYPNGTTITAVEMANTAFYPLVNTTDSWITAINPAQAVTLLTSPKPTASTAAAAIGGLVPEADVTGTFPAMVTYNAGNNTFTLHEGYRLDIDTTPYGGTGIVSYVGPCTISDPAAVAALHTWVAPSQAFMLEHFVVNPNYQVIINGTVYDGNTTNNIISDPQAVALLSDPATRDRYCFVLANSQVTPGYQVTGSDGNIYPGGALIPFNVTVVPNSELQMETSGTQNTLMSWYPTAVSNNGLPLMVANFTAQEQAMTVGSPKGQNYLIEMDLGLKVSNLANPWANGVKLPGSNRIDYPPLGASRNAASPPLGTGPGPFAPDPLAIDPYDSLTWGDYSGLAGINGQPVRNPQSTNLVGASSSSTQVSRQNGYTYGNLMDIYVDQFGILSGIYSNGVTLSLYQVVLYDFVAPQHLRFEGGNLVSQTRESGDPSWGAAGTAGFGTVQSFCIEQSNVDLAKEMVHMITTQRGFQANSKVITTVDTMLEVVVNMKR
jgi:flagellar hook protein FlgE